MWVEHAIVRFQGHYSYRYVNDYLLGCGFRISRLPKLSNCGNWRFEVDLAERRISVGRLSPATLCLTIGRPMIRHKVGFSFCATASRTSSLRQICQDVRYWIADCLLSHGSADKIIVFCTNQGIINVGRSSSKEHTTCFNLSEHLCAPYVRRYCHPRTPCTLGSTLKE